MAKVTKKDVQENMQDFIVKTEVEFGKPVTYVTVRMKNGFTLRESTTCVDPENYDESVGAKICLEKIEDKIWMLLGYELQSKVNATQPQDENEPEEECEDECEDCPLNHECGDDEEVSFEDFLDFVRHGVCSRHDDDDEIEDDDEDKKDDTVHINLMMSSSTFGRLLDRFE